MPRVTGIQPPDATHRQIKVLKGSLKALWFYEEPSATDEPLFHLRHHYRLYEELFEDMVFKEPWFERFFVEPEMMP